MKDQVVHAFEKNVAETVRCGVTEYRGTPVFYFRVFFAGPDGELLPTKKGITLSLAKFEDLEAGVAKIRKALERAGHLKKKGRGKS